MKKKKVKEIGITALYERLSRDDDGDGDSNSIVHQKQMLETYAKEHGFINLHHYTDDGWSGASFDRPASAIAPKKLFGSSYSNEGRCALWFIRIEYYAIPKPTFYHSLQAISYQKPLFTLFASNVKRANMYRSNVY